MPGVPWVPRVSACLGAGGARGAKGAKGARVLKVPWVHACHVCQSERHGTGDNAGERGGEYSVALTCRQIVRDHEHGHAYQN